MKRVSNDFTKALNYSFVLLKFRKRSGRELRLRLEAKGYGAADIEAVLAYLVEKRLIKLDKSCEALEAAELAHQAVAKFKKLEPERARKRLFTYLTSRGFSPETVNDTIARF